MFFTKGTCFLFGKRKKKKKTQQNQQTKTNKPKPQTKKGIHICMRCDPQATSSFTTNSERRAKHSGMVFSATKASQPLLSIRTAVSPCGEGTPGPAEGGTRGHRTGCSSPGPRHARYRIRHSCCCPVSPGEQSKAA